MSSPFQFSTRVRHENRITKARKPAGRASRTPAAPLPDMVVPAGRWRTHASVALVLGVLCAALYAWTADFPLVFDDDYYLVNNPVFRDAASFDYPSRFSEFATRPGKMGTDPDLATNFIMRPVAYATFRLNYIFDGFNPRWYRVVNIFIHAASCFVLYALLRVLLGRVRGGSCAQPPGSRLFIPLVAALLFAVHPLATESVTYIIQRFTSLAALFYLLALGLHFASLRTASPRGVIAWRTGSVLAVLLGMQTKECTFTAPFMAVLIDHIVLGARLRTAAWRALPLLACLPVVPVLVILVATAQNDGHFSIQGVVNVVNSLDQPISHWHYIVTQITVVAAYLRSIFWPAGLHLDPSWPHFRSLADVSVLKALAFLAAVVASAAWFWRRRRDDVRARLVFVFTLWFFITVCVSSGMVPLPDMMADHRAHLPSAGVFVAVAALLDMLRTLEWRPRLVRTLACGGAAVAVVALCAATCVRNEVWRSNQSVWEHTVSRSPGNHRAWGNLGAAFAEAGRQEEARACFEKALEIKPDFRTALLNLSGTLLKLGRPKESLDHSLKLFAMPRGRNSDVLFIVALGLAGTGKINDAISAFDTILQHNPEHEGSNLALGVILLDNGRPARALEHLRRVALRRPQDARLHESIRMAERALAISTPAAAPLMRLNLPQ
ncbi:MAG: tetratricopeptide repeat protein [Verrucomicrobiaceae bacterium]|nr:tetratricopeptide repeat protein [Verrucomicrobiaceae bacterium]